MTAISISSSGKPESSIWDKPSIARRSYSICLAICFKVAKSTSSPLKKKSKVSRMFSCFATTNGSIPEGKLGTRSTAFFTSESITSISSSISISTVILPPFSLDVEVTRSMPTNPFRLSSIFKTIPSSISSGAAPGYVTLIVIISDSINGKKDDCIFNIPITPKITMASSITFTAT